MPDENQQGDSLRDALLSAVAEHRDDDESGIAGGDGAETSISSTESDASPLGQDTPLRDTRPRDEAGRYTRAEGGQVAPAGSGVAPTFPGAASAGSGEAPAPPATVAAPSSWRKEHQESFGRLDPSLQNYILQREREFATGVSTYKAQADQARSLQTAMEPFLPELARHNIQPEQWITNLGRAHYTLVQGSPVQKAETFMRLAQDYGVDLSQFGGNAQPGQQSAPQNPEAIWMQQQLGDMRQQLQAFQQQQHQAQQNALRQEQAMVEKSIADFSADTGKYPHFAAVRETMAGLLQSGLAHDLPSAYDKAIRMHDDLWSAQQADQQKAAGTAQQRAAADAAAKARAKVSSIRSATPSGEPAGAEEKGLRAQLRDAMTKHSAGRV